MSHFPLVSRTERADRASGPARRRHRVLPDAAPCTRWPVTGICTAGVLLGVVSFLLLPVTRAYTAPPEESSRSLVFLNRAEPVRHGDEMYVRVKGSCPDVPPGAEIEFHLTWRSMTVQVYPVKVEESRRLQFEMPIDKIPRSHEKFYFRTIIRGHRQPASVREAIAASPAFDPSLDPWTDHHFGHRFRLLTIAEQDAALIPIREFFQRHYSLILEFDVAVGERAELAIIGEEYATPEGEFDSDAWRGFVDEEVMETLRTCRSEVKQHEPEAEYLPYRRALLQLDELAEDVAVRTVFRSRNLYRELGLPVHSRDTAVEGFELKRRKRPPSDRRIADRILVIEQEIGIVPTSRVEEPFQFVNGEHYEGVIFRHLTADELARGKFDPTRTAATWTPTLEQIAALEEGLGAFLAGRHPELARGLAESGRYRRQYAGLGPPEARVIRCLLVRSRSAAEDRLLEEVATPSADSLDVIQVDFAPTSGRYSEWEGDG